MSTRNLRKYQQRLETRKTEQSQLPIENSSSSSDEQSDEQLASNSCANSFNILKYSHSSGEDFEQSEVHGDVRTLSPSPDVTQRDRVKHAVGRTAKRRNKKNKQRVALSQEREFDELCECVEITSLGQKQSNKISSTQNPNLVEKKHLKETNELQRRFGRDVIAESSRSPYADMANGKRFTKSYLLCSNVNQFSKITQNLLSMEIARQDGDITWFRFEHSKRYRELERHFTQCVVDVNVGELIEMLDTARWHVNLLLFMSTYARQSMEDAGLAAHTLDNALFVLERSFHTQFSCLTSRSRLDYAYRENRCMYLAGFAKCRQLFSKGCYRTALEWAKMLFMWQSLEDHLSFILLLDVYALWSRQHQWLISFYEFWLVEKNLNLLPNWMFSYAAAFCQLKGQDDKDKVIELVKNAIMTFPCFVALLVAKYNVTFSFPLAKIFNIEFVLDKFDNMNILLTELYLERTHKLWQKSPLIDCVRQALLAIHDSECDDYVHLISDYCSDSAYHSVDTKLASLGNNVSDALRAIVRHVLCSKDLDEELNIANAHLYWMLFPSNVLYHDPLPPNNSSSGYPITAQRTRTQNRNRSSNPIVEFVHSLSPTYQSDT